MKIMEINQMYLFAFTLHAYFMLEKQVDQSH